MQSLLENPNTGFIYLYLMHGCRPSILLDEVILFETAMRLYPDTGLRQFSRVGYLTFSEGSDSVKPHPPHSLLFGAVRQS